jgi:hypothetical protein
MELILEGRSNDENHSSAKFTISPFRIGAPPPKPRLPVAAIPLERGERLIAQRGKVRPAIVVAAPAPAIPGAIRAGSPRYQTAPTVLVAPSFGAVADGTRGGWPAPFVQRIRRCEYPQYHWDRLPVGGAAESIVRLDHIQPVGDHYSGLALTPFRLSDEAMILFDQRLTWYMTGVLAADTDFAEIREHLLKAP